ncbi:MAG: hypothetical protein M0Z60_15370, partial [Nitrospiraceae bacterium]|nr:hypothetical protein [Nitrospiraceae bacterium]
YEDVTGLSPFPLRDFVSQYLLRNRTLMEDARSDAGRFLNTKGYSLSVQEFSPNDIAISVKNDKDGYLLYGDGWSRYWRAFDGESEIPVEIANYNSKAVYLKKGLHTVRFVFDPVH